MIKMSRASIIKDTIIEYALNKSLNESKSAKLVKNYLKSRGYDDIDDIKNIRGRILQNIPNVRLDDEKFMLGCVRMYLDNELGDIQSIRSLNNALKLIHAGGHVDDYDFDLNGLHIDELSNTFREIQKSMGTNDRKRSADAQITGKCDYKIIPINSFEEAQQYKKYTNSNQPWCVTSSVTAFEQYTKGGNRFYFCLQNGFQEIKRNDTDAPLNKYGLSMIAVNVDANGDLTRITTRYNHDFDGENNPGLETTEQLERVLNVKFYDTFKPYTKDELHQMGIILFDEVQDLLDNGTPADEIFEWVDDPFENIRRVRLNDKYNFINSKNKLISTK